MGEILVVEQPEQISIQTYEEKKLAASEVRLKTLYSGISAGTQLTLYRGTNPYQKKQWNPDIRIFEAKSQEQSIYPINGGWGYEEVGEVTEIGEAVENIAVGDVVFGQWGHLSTHIVSENYAKERKMDKSADPLTGIFSQIGAIALNAILDADIHVGETVAVFGQGVPGQIVTQLAKLNGANVIAVDLDEYRLEISRKNGADVVLNPGKQDIAREIKERTEGRGADVSIEIAGTTEALHEAVRSTVYSGRVVCAGFLQGGANHLYLGEEFHHNRISIVGSQISGVSPALSNRWNRIRKDKTIMELQNKNKIDLKSLISHTFSFHDSHKAYELLHQNQEKIMQVVLKFEQ